MRQGKQTRIQELEYEIEVYREELYRLRSLLGGSPPAQLEGGGGGAQGKESESDQSHIVANGQPP